MANRVFRLRFCCWPFDEIGLPFSNIESDAALRADDAMRGMIKETEPKLVRDEAPLVVELIPLPQHPSLSSAHST